MNVSSQLVDTTWDFREADTKEYTHCYHNYPAMMIPQIARRLITEYGQGAKMLFDPYCGTGTSLVEANLQGINACGTDLNPMARLIARTKTTKIDLQIVDLYLKEFNDYIFAAHCGIRKFNAIAPLFKNIDFWFTTDVKQKLAIIKSFIDNIKETHTQNFFLVAFSETVRESSLTRNSEFKLYRMPERQRDAFCPDVFGMMNGKLARNRFGLKRYLDENKTGTSTHVYDFNSSDGIGAIQDCSVDIVVTSPPYGDSKTTVAYGQFSRLSNQWLGVENACQIDNQLMGGKKQKIQAIGIDCIDSIVDSIQSKHKKRAQEVYSFYSEYSQSIANVATVIKDGGYACYVVGNRRVKAEVLPTDEVTQCLFEAQGFTHKNTFIRNIPNKRMPNKNSPTNEIGKTATTMNNEYIVIMQKS